MPLNPQQASVVVIGAGIGGLAAAIRLAAQGKSVTLCEKNSRTGGKLNTWTVTHPFRPCGRPYHFDLGPGLLTLPLVFADLFAVAGADVRNHLQITRLNPVSKFIWPDGTELALPDTSDSLLKNISTVFPGDEDGVNALLRYGEKIWRLSGEFFLTRSPEQALRGDGAFNPFNALKMLTLPFRIGMFRKYAARVDAHVRSPRLRDVFYQYAMYAGASPFRAPATLGVIPYVELGMGAWYVQGGMYRIAAALEALARSLGVNVRLDTPVRRVLVEGTGEDRRAVGVETADGQVIRSDAVIVNADVVYAYRHLIDAPHRPTFTNARLDTFEPGGSAFVLLLGVEGTYPQLAHHTKFMPNDYAAELRAIFDRGAVPDDPCIYVCAGTRSDPTRAPEGCESLFVLCSAPPLDGSIDWGIEGPKYRDRILHALEHRFGLTDLSKRIAVERMITPADMQLMYNANAGSIYGISSNGMKQAFLRPPNRDRDIRGLFFAGGATHPGGGLPLVALSGKIASELALEYLQ